MIHRRRDFKAAPAATVAAPHQVPSPPPVALYHLQNQSWNSCYFHFHFLGFLYFNDKSTFLANESRAAKSRQRFGGMNVIFVFSSNDEMFSAFGHRKSAFGTDNIFSTVAIDGLKIANWTDNSNKNDLTQQNQNPGLNQKHLASATRQFFRRFPSLRSRRVSSIGHVL